MIFTSIAALLALCLAIFITGRHWRSLPGMLLLIGLAVSPVALYALEGRSGAPDQPLARRDLAAERQAAADQLARQLTGALKQNPGNTDAWLQLAQLHLAMGDLLKAETALQGALILDRNNIKSLALLAEVRAARRRGMVDDRSAKLWQRILKREPANPTALYYLGVRALQHGDDLEAAKYWDAIRPAEVLKRSWYANFQEQYQFLQHRLGRLQP
jgi:cytochrome c-type biogenesis protein CcmH/NrfG